MMCHWSTRCQKSKCRAVDDQRRLIVTELSLTHRHRHQMALLSTTSSHRHSLPHTNKQQSANKNELATSMPSSYWFPSSSSSSSCVACSTTQTSVSRVDNSDPQYRLRSPWMRWYCGSESFEPWAQNVLNSSTSPSFPGKWSPRMKS